ncbi:unnamed protein product [Staurois parvus]|uniref:Uncharacterized protein n=1 Tax=Staurois parvus TaxID=386267 RepID=A0ABN9H2H5_9NEOB|nr:unnamed protein product [Staurois parvus]
MPLPLGVMLVTVSFAMPHGTCSSTTAGGATVAHSCPSPWSVSRPHPDITGV